MGNFSLIGGEIGGLLAGIVEDKILLGASLGVAVGGIISLGLTLLDNWLISMIKSQLEGKE